jgi:cyclin-A
MQIRNRPSPNYLETVQKTVTSDMRAVLIDWLVEVAEEYKLVTETLYLTVAYLDRYLSAHHIDPPQLQLLGITSMCIAAKFEEIFPPPIEKYSEITDKGCTVQDIAGAEMQVLRVLNFHIAVPTAKVRHASTHRTSAITVAVPAVTPASTGCRQST